MSTLSRPQLTDYEGLVVDYYDKGRVIYGKADPAHVLALLEIWQQRHAEPLLVDPVLTDAIGAAAVVGEDAAALRAWRAELGLPADGDDYLALSNFLDTAEI